MELIMKKPFTKETLYKLAFKEACDMLVRTKWYKTNASAEGSILTLIKKRYGKPTRDEREDKPK